MTEVTPEMVAGANAMAEWSEKFKPESAKGQKATHCGIPFSTLRQGQPKMEGGKVIALEVGGKGTYHGLAKQHRPRFVRILGALLRGRSGGCSVCQRFTQWMWLVGNRAHTFELTLCSRCEGIWLSRHFQAYRTLRSKVKAGKMLETAGGYSGPLFKSREAA